MFFCSMFAQNPNLPAQHDHIWLTGYASFYEPGENPDNLPFGGSRIDFNKFPLSINFEQRLMDLEFTLGIMCDEKGDLLFYTNGDSIINHQEETIENSEGFNSGTWNSQIRLQQGIVILPSPKQENEFYLFHEPRADDGEITDLYYSVVDMNENGGLGKVTEKSVLLLSDSLDVGKVTATKHANGRDWWILVPEFYNQFYYTILLDKSGVTSIDTQHIDIQILETHGIGQAVFSPDGSKYARTTSELFTDGTFLEIFDFDRCTGKLSNQQVISYVPTRALGRPVAFSPNSRYLYLTESLTFYQFDTWVDDIAESEIILGRWDGFKYFDVISVLPWMAQLGPDGKIYIATTSSNPYLHVIHDPDMGGKNSRFEERAILLPSLNGGTMANHPNYRLGPIDGSACDTLGLDNLPVANFRQEYFLDTFNFRDLSVGTPTEWSWDFGDGNTSNEPHNNHIYDSHGEYLVCLTVSNANGSDTWCDTVLFGISNTNELEFTSVESFIYPNPTSGEAYLNLNQRLHKSAELIIFDALGRVVLQQNLPSGQKVFPIALHPLSNGMYFYTLQQNGVRIGKGKLIKG